MVSPSRWFVRNLGFWYGFGLKGGGGGSCYRSSKKDSVAAFRETSCFCWIIRLVVLLCWFVLTWFRCLVTAVRVCCARKGCNACCALLLQGKLVRESVRVGGRFIYWTVWLERDIMIVVVARSCWFLDPFCVDGWSIHRKLDIHRCCFYFFVSPDWVDLHFVWIDWVRFVSPNSFLYLFFPFLIIYMSTWHRLEFASHSNSVGLSSTPFFYVIGLLPYQKNMQKMLELVLGVCCNNLTKKMMKMNMMKCAHKFQRLFYILVVGKRLLHLKPKKFNGYACKTQSACGYHTNLKVRFSQTNKCILDAIRMTSESPSKYYEFLDMYRTTTPSVSPNGILQIYGSSNSLMD